MFVYHFNQVSVLNLLVLVMQLLIMRNRITERHSESGENESDDSEIGRRKVESQLDLTSSDDEEKGLF